MNWDLPLGSGHFGVSGAFLMKQISFKMMKRMSLKRIIMSLKRMKSRMGVNLCRTSHEIDLSKQRTRPFWTSQFIWDPTDPLYFLFKDVLGFSGDFFVVEEIAKAKGILPTQTKKNPSKSISIADSLFLNTTQEKYFRKVLRLVIARDALDPIVYHLMDLSVLILYPRVLSIYQISSYLTKGYGITWQRHCWEKDGFSRMNWKWYSWNSRKVSHSLAGKICSHERGIK